MNLTIERAALLRALSHAQSVLDRKNTIPILSNVLLRAEDGVLTIAATDMDQEIVETMPAQVSRPGAITMPGVLLHGLVRTSAEGSQIEIACDDDKRAIVRCGRSVSKLPVLPAEDFPALKMVGDGADFELPAKQFMQMLKRASVCVNLAALQTYAYLGGVYLHSIGHILLAAATDSKMLARTEAEVPDGSRGFDGVTIPIAAVAQLSKILEDCDGQVRIQVGENLMVFTVGGTKLSSKMIDGRFPDYPRIIPTENRNILEIDRAPMIDALNRAALFCDNKDNKTFLVCGPATLEMSAIGPNGGEWRESVECAYRGADLRIVFNCRRLLTILGAIDADVLKFSFGEPDIGAIISGLEDQSTIYVLMPLRA